MQKSQGIRERHPYRPIITFELGSITGIPRLAIPTIYHIASGWQEYRFITHMINTINFLQTIYHRRNATALLDGHVEKFCLHMNKPGPPASYDFPFGQFLLRSEPSSRDLIPSSQGLSPYHTIQAGSVTTGPCKGCCARSPHLSCDLPTRDKKVSATLQQRIPDPAGINYLV